MKPECHFHTNLSDWVKSSHEIVEMALEAWVDVLVATEHDLINTELKDIAKEKWILSYCWVEISTLVPWRENSTKDIHFTAYAKTFNQDIFTLLEWIRIWRNQKVQIQLKSMSDYWFKISYDEFIDYFIKQSTNIFNLNISHIADYLLLFEINKDKLIELFWYNPNRDEMIKKLLKRWWQYASIWAPDIPEYVKPISYVWPMLKKCNGIYAIAHANLTFEEYNKSTSDLSTNETKHLENFIQENLIHWINWIEINATAQKDWVKFIIEVWKKYNLFFTFWSDFHNKKDEVHWNLGDINPFVSPEFVTAETKKVLEKLQI